MYLLAVIGFTEVIRRLTGVEQMTQFKTMITVSALIANGMTLHLLQRSESTQVHMRARIPANSNPANRRVTLTRQQGFMTNGQ